MNEYILVGKLVNTHGIKGEVKILSDFEYKERIFKKDFKLYLGNNKEEMIIESYRHHKIFDMVTFKGISNINEVLKYKGAKVYVKRCDLKLLDGEYLYSDLVGKNIVENKIVLGKVREIVYNNSNILLKCEGSKVFYIPLKSNYIIKIDKDIETQRVRELML